MDIRNNMIVGWVLTAIFVALSLSIVGGMYFHAERPEKMGYPIEGVVEAVESGAAVAAPVVPIEVMMATAEVTKGADVFKKCSACHNVAEGGANGIGPNLWASVGKAVAQGAGGYVFSDVLKGHGGKWDFATLNDWLENPRKFAAGTKMTFAGLASPEDRANVIAYLNAQGSNLPIPAAPAADAEPAETETETAKAETANATAPAE